MCCDVCVCVCDESVRIMYKCWLAFVEYYMNAYQACKSDCFQALALLMFVSTVHLRIRYRLPYGLFSDYIVLPTIPYIWRVHAHE